MSCDSIDFNCHLWTKLRESDAIAARIFPSRHDPGFGSLGLILCELEQWDYHCTPTNVIPFAYTGGDGAHFSFLALDNEVTDDSPIVMTAPAPGGEPNWIVGENLFDFLCLGYYRGFHALEQLPYNTDLTLKVLTDPAWRLTEEWRCDFHLDEERTRVLEFLVQHFGLKPWLNLLHLDRLQERYFPRLQIPEFKP